MVTKPLKDIVARDPDQGEAALAEGAKEEWYTYADKDKPKDHDEHDDDEAEPSLNRQTSRDEVEPSLTRRREMSKRQSSTNMEATGQLSKRDSMEVKRDSALPDSVPEEDDEEAAGGAGRSPPRRLSSSRPRESIDRSSKEGVAPAAEPTG
jgi:hypothetical protein